MKNLIKSLSFFSWIRKFILIIDWLVWECHIVKNGIAMYDVADNLYELGAEIRAGRHEPNGVFRRFGMKTEGNVTGQ